MNRSKMVKLFIFIIVILLIIASIYSWKESKEEMSSDNDGSIQFIPQIMYDSDRQSFEDFLYSETDGQYSPEKGSFEEYLNSDIESHTINNKIAKEDITVVKKVSFNSLSKNITKIKESAVLADEQALDKTIKQATTNSGKLSDRIKIAKADVVSNVAKEFLKKCEDLNNRIINELSTLRAKSLSEIETISRAYEKEVTAIIAEAKVVARRK